MNSNWHLNPAIWSYGIVALAFGIFSVQLVAGRRGRQRAVYLLAGTALSAAWAASAAVYSLAASPTWWRITHVLDAARIGALLAFLLVVTLRTGRDAAAPGITAVRAPRISLLLLAGFVVLTVFAAEPPQVPLLGEGRATSLVFGLLLARTVLGLVLVEQ
ncbi:MAG TPA: hypothetical protein VEN28_15765, partial [Burkholderiaceae bacterium]|nr:hypothetical protein [Burkholderiaceae bacterium]